MTVAETRIMNLWKMGVGFSVTREEMLDWLVNSYTPYPFIAEGLLDLLTPNGLEQRPVNMDTIVYCYEQIDGRSPRAADEVKPSALEAAVVQASNNQYGGEAIDFTSLLRSSLPG